MLFNDRKVLLVLASSVKRAVHSRSSRQCTGVIFDQALYSLTNFLTGVFLARSLAKDDYGIYVLALSFILIIMGVQRAVISVPYTIYSQRHVYEERQAYEGSVFAHQLILLMVSTLLCLAALNFVLLERELGSDDLIVFITFSIAVAGVLSRDFIRYFLLSSLQVRQTIWMGISINVIQLAILSNLYLQNAITINNSFLTIGFCALLPSLIIFLKNSSIRLAGNSITKHFLENLKSGKWILGEHLVFVLSSQAYPWLLAIFADKRSVAVLGVASFLANILAPFLQGVNAFILPKMVQSKAGIVRMLKKAIACLSVAFVLWLISGILFGDYLLTSIYSAKYSGYGSVLVILILSSFASGITGPINAALVALERADIAFKSLVGGLAITVLIGAILTYTFGLYGAALGILLSNLINCLLRWRGLLTLMSRVRVPTAGRPAHASLK